MKPLWWLVLAVRAGALAAQTPSGAEILRRVDRNMFAQSRIVVSQMIVHGRRETRTVESRTWQRGTSDAFTEYLAPARERGTKMLKLADNLWTYSPSTDRVIMISGSMLRQAVMGSDLSPGRARMGARFGVALLPTVRGERSGFQLSGIDLAINKLLALVGRDEPRDYLDIHEAMDLLPLGALCWAAAGKDPGFTPAMLLDLLRRRGRYRPEDFARLHLAQPVDLPKLKLRWLAALDAAEHFFTTRDPSEVGCLYYSRSLGKFVEPQARRRCGAALRSPGRRTSRRGVASRSKASRKPSPIGWWFPGWWFRAHVIGTTSLFVSPIVYTPVLQVGPKRVHARA